MARVTKRRPKAKGRWGRRIRRTVRVARGARAVGRAPFRAINQRFGYYLCPHCRQRHPQAERANWEHIHSVDRQILEADKRREQAEQKQQRQQRRKSKTVADEQKRRGRQQPPKQPRRRQKTAQQKARERWGKEIDKRRQNMANGNGGGGATLPARYIAAAAKALVDFEPAHHGEMKELAVSMNAALGELSRGVETFHENRVRQRFHPRVLTPLDVIQSALADGRAGWIQMINLIERHYAAWFEAARAGGPIPGQKPGEPSYFDESQAG